MSSHSVLIVGLMLFSAASIASCVVNISCDGGAECSTCYNLLVQNLLNSDGNQFNMTRAFFPPSKVPPVSVIVYYDFKDDDGVIDPSERQLWFWTTSTYYHFQPLSVLQYVSLFFTDPVLRLQYLYLTLDISCANARTDYMQTLTQRLKLHVMNYAAVPTITEDYQPKADSVETLNTTLRNNPSITDYSIAHQVLLPFFIIVASFFAISYLVFCEPHKLETTYIVNNDLSDSKRWQMKANLLIALAMSVVFSAYSCCMTVIGVTLGRYQTQKEFGENWFRYELHQFYVLSIIIAVQDGVTFLASLTVLIFCFCGWCCKKENQLCCCCCWCQNQFCGVCSRCWHKEDTDEEGTTVDQLCCCCWHCNKKTGEKWKKKIQEVWQNIEWYLCAYSLLFPIANIAIHTNLIIIGFIHNSYHATAVGLTYGGLTLISIASLKGLSSLIVGCYNTTTCANKEGRKDAMSGSLICILIVALALAVLSYAFVIALYFILPINIAFDEAPNRIRDIYQSIVLLFAGLITYWVVIKRPKSPLDFMIRANEAENQEFKMMSYDDKESDIAQKLLKIMNAWSASQNNGTRSVGGGGGLGGGGQGGRGQSSGGQSDGGQSGGTGMK